MICKRSKNNDTGQTSYPKRLPSNLTEEQHSLKEHPLDSVYFWICNEGFDHLNWKRIRETLRNMCKSHACLLGGITGSSIAMETLEKVVPAKADVKWPFPVMSQHDSSDDRVIKPGCKAKQQKPRQFKVDIHFPYWWLTFPPCMNFVWQAGYQ